MRARQLGLAALVVIGLALIVVALSRWQPADDPPPRQNPQPQEPSGTAVPPDRRVAWQVPRTSDARLFAEGVVTAIWTYDSRAHSYDQWRSAVAAFVDSAGTPASRQVALGMLPAWAQWEDLVRQSARARVVSIRTTVPAELATLAKDPRAPAGWHAFAVSADQTVRTSTRQSTVVRRASVSVVCAPRCYLWSVTPEGPR